MKHISIISISWWKNKLSIPHTNPHHPSSEYRIVFESLLLSSFILIAIVSILLLISYFSFDNGYVIKRIFLCALSLFYLAFTQVLWTRGHASLASKFLILFYFLIAGLILFNWGINIPFGLLLLAITIILAGILLGARYTLYATAMSILLLFGIQMSVSFGLHTFQTSDIPPSEFGDAIAYSTLLSILALISWLFGRQTERLLFKNRQAERALLKEKESLEIRVAERTDQLQKAQLKEMQQFYQFAEMGQLSAALLHDLANHLSVLTFDIADLKQQQHTQALKRAEESVGYLEQAVRQVRQQLKGESEQQRFDAIACVQDSLKIVAQKAAKHQATIIFNTPKKPLFIMGDPLRLSHIITILVRNAIEAYKDKAGGEKPIIVTIEQAKQTVVIHIRDEGSGITPARRKSLFTPGRSTKKEGLGIGLFIANKIVETHFKGTLSLASATSYTEFIVELPKARS